MNSQRPSERLIFKAAWRSQGEVRDLLQSIFACELLTPSSCVWLVSPWISDVGVIDNRAGSFEIGDSSWSGRRVGLSEVLAQLLSAGTTVRVAMRPDTHNNHFQERLLRRSQAAGVADRLFIDKSEELHEKGLLSDAFFLSGSMNMTYNGIELLEEAVRFTSDRNVVAMAQLSYRDRWGGPI